MEFGGMGCSVDRTNSHPVLVLSGAQAEVDVQSSCSARNLNKATLMQHSRLLIESCQHQAANVVHMQVQEKGRSSVRDQHVVESTRPR